MDIKGLGEENIRALIAEGYLSDIADIYDLRGKRDELIERGIVGKEKNTDKVLASIEASKHQEADRLLTGLAIPNVGKTSARTILKAFGTMDALMNASVEELTAVPDVGGVTAKSVWDFFRRDANRALIRRLRDAGLTMTEENAAADDSLAGRSYVITGEVHVFGSRKELGAFIESRGGRLAGAVSKKTAALINNDPASASGKNKKAKELGIPILTEEEFLASVNEGGRHAG
jgi:DNA ligase (NAD+)